VAANYTLSFLMLDLRNREKPPDDQHESIAVKGERFWACI
jgi:hypothetical protein